jgi:hypothetical protein
VVAATAVLLLTLPAAAYQNGDSGAVSKATPAGTALPVNNVQPVVVDPGPIVNGQAVGYDNSLYTTVTICVPGTTTCQSIDHVLVDTGSTGLRILSSEMTINVPFSTDADNNTIGNCVQYLDGTYQWGPLAKVDVKLAGETAPSVPIQIVGAGNVPAAPRSCRAGGFPGQTVADLGAKGILGVGLFRQDCGSACTSLSSAPAVYYSCSSTRCSVAAVALSDQLQNPVWMFPQDNNGLAIVLPQIVATGGLSVTGSMIFGIGTQTNNALSGAQALGADEVGNITTTFNGTAYAGSFIDSGSNGYFFLDSSATGLPDCSDNSDAPGFYCPSTPVNLTAVNSGRNPNGSATRVSSNVAFSVSNAVPLIDSPETAFNNLGGFGPGGFDWGIPYFFGRTVFIGIEGQKSTAGIGPYWATISPDCNSQLSLGGEAFTAAGGTGSVAITTAAGCDWTVDSLPAGITLTSPASGVGSGTVSFTVLPNNGGDLVNTFVIAGQSFTINQEAASITGLNLIGSMPHLAAEENWTTTFTLVNKGTTSATARLSLFGDPIDPTGGGALALPLTFPQRPTASGPLLAQSLDQPLASNASLIVATAGPQTPPVQEGSAQLAATGAVDGFAIFHLIPGAQEAVVPLETRNAGSYLLAFDNTGGVVLAVALENVTAQAATIGIVIRDDSGTVIGTPGATISLAANGHMAFVLPGMFPVTAGKRGTIEFDTPAGGRISMLGIRTTPLNSTTNTLTTIPALANVGTGGGSFAFVASGGDGWQTTFVLMNAGSTSAPITLQFFDPNGNAMPLPLSYPQSSSGTVTQASSVTQSLPGAATLIVESSGAPTLLTGSAQLTTTGNVSGFVIFRYNPTGQEAVVPMESRGAGAYVLAFDNTSGTATGIAVNNASGPTQAVIIPMVLRDDSGKQLATQTLTLPANGEFAGDLTQFSSALGTVLFPQAANIRGTVEFAAPAGVHIGVIGIRTPAALTYTTLPALAK